MTFRSLVKAGINDVLVFAGFASIFAIPVVYLWKGTLSLWWLLLWLPLFGFLRVARTHIRSFGLFFLLHGTLIAAPIVLLTITNAFSPLVLVAFLLIGIVSALFSVFYRFHPLPSPYVLLWPGCLAGAVAGLFTARFEAPELTGFEMMCVILLLTFTPLLRQIENLDDSISVLESNGTSMDKAQLLRQNNATILACAVAIVAGSAAIPLLTQGAVVRFLRLVGDQLLTFLRWLFSFLPQSSEAVQDIPTSEPISRAGLDVLDTGAEPSLLGDILQVLFSLIILAVSIVALVAAGMLIVNLYRRFNASKDSGNDRIEILRGINRSDRLDRKKPPKMDFGTGEERRVRKLYYRTVRRHSGGLLPLPSDTTGAILKEHQAISGFDELTAKYDCVRYNKRQDSHLK